MLHVSLVGFMAAGKSTVGSRLATRLRRPFVDLDERIVAATGQDIATVFATAGEDVFREHERRELEAALTAPAPLVLATGGGVVEDAGNCQRLRESSVVVWIDLRLETVRARLAAAPAGVRPLVARLGWDGLILLHRRRRALYADVAHFRFDGDHLAPAVLARRIAVALQAVGPT